MTETLTPWAEEDIAWLEAERERLRDARALANYDESMCDEAEDAMMRKAHAAYTQKMANRMREHTTASAALRSREVAAQVNPFGADLIDAILKQTAPPTDWSKTTRLGEFFAMGEVGPPVHIPIIADRSFPRYQAFMATTPGGPNMFAGIDVGEGGYTSAVTIKNLGDGKHEVVDSMVIHEDSKP